MRLSDIAAALNARLEGDGSIEITRVVHPADAQTGSDLALAMEPALLAEAAAGPARAGVVAAGVDVPDGALDGWVVVGRPRLAMFGLLNLFERPAFHETGVHPTAWVHPSATLGEGVSVGPFVSIGSEVEIGAGTVILSHTSIARGARVGEGGLLHSGVRIGERVVLGARCIVQPNAVIGGDGFSFVTPEPGSVEMAKATGAVGAGNTVILRINSIGTVIIGDDVEIGAGAAIDRGTVTATRIGSGTKIDNLVQIGHNVQVGTNCMLCGQVGIAGSATLGDRVVLGGQVGVADHVTIGNDAVVGASSGVGSDIAPRTVSIGLPAMPKADFFSQLKNLRRLKRLIADVSELKKRLGVG